MKKNKFITNGLILFFMLMLLTKCVDITDVLFYGIDKQAKKMIRKILSQSRDERLQGWWKDREIEFLYFDVSSGQQRNYQPGYNYGLTGNYWSTSDGLLHELECVKDGSFIVSIYYKINEDTLKMSSSPFEEKKHIRTYLRITNQVQLDSLKQYEYPNPIPPPKPPNKTD